VTNYLKQKAQGHEAHGSGGNVLVYVLLFLVGSALIVGGVIAWQRGVEKRERALASAEAEIEYAKSAESPFTEQYYEEERGFKSNDPPPAKETVEAETPREQEPNYRFVGDNRYKMYHRPECRHVSLLPRERRTLLSSEAEAWSRGFIPCKVCKPPLPRVARAETEPEQPPPETTKAPTPSPPTWRPTRVDPTVPAKAEAPIELKVEDVDVPFEFKVVKSVPDVYRGVVQVDITVDTNRALQRDEVLSLARKLVAAAIRERKVNAISMFMRTDPKLRLTVKWVCTVEWAPYGSLSRATEVQPGDYRNHKFRIYQMGFFTP
jgi:hypothetical protein